MNSKDYGNISRNKMSSTGFPTDDTDLRLVFERIQQGDSFAYQALFDRYHRRVIGFVRRYVDSADIEDICQEIFLRVFSKLLEIHDIQAFESYLFRAAKNHCINWLRKKKRFLGMMQTACYAYKTWSEESSPFKSKHWNQIEDLIETLPEDIKKYIQLFYFEKRSRTEISAMLSESNSTVYRRLAEAKAALVDAARKQKVELIFEGRHDVKIK